MDGGEIDAQSPKPSNLESKQYSEVPSAPRLPPVGGWKKAILLRLLAVIIIAANKRKKIAFFQPPTGGNFGAEGTSEYCFDSKLGGNRG